MESNVVQPKRVIRYRVKLSPEDRELLISVYRKIDQRSRDIEEKFVDCPKVFSQNADKDNVGGNVVSLRAAKADREKTGTKDRLGRIAETIEKISRLMEEVKKLNNADKPQLRRIK